MRFHRDPSLFPFPEEFNTGNWTAEAKAKRGPYGFFGFGQGPRNCIGMRFALIELKFALIQVLANFKIVACDKTPMEIVIDPKSIQGLPKGGTWVKVERRQ